MDTSDPREQDAAAFDAVTTGFYRDRDAQLAAAALRHWLRMVAEASDEQLARMMVLFYVFARVSQTDAASRDAFTPILRGYAAPHAELAQRLLEVAEDPSFPNAISIPIQGPEGLDLLWAEFFVTGEAAPVERIFATLDGDDRMRMRLEAWLRESPLFGGSKRRATAAELAAAGLVVDLERKIIVTTGDLDCVCFQIAERRVPIFKMLPFEIAPADFTSLGIKGSAIWSLRLNARSHEKVAAICRVESQRPGGPGRRLAAEPSPDAPPFAL
ncbi:MAG TPA: hypothetical protein VM261_26260 [Kofleriaceae bacterium]|nr:hypothetical protein [Kofleriaceae bacterium]